MTTFCPDKVWFAIEKKNVAKPDERVDHWFCELINELNDVYRQEQITRGKRERERGEKKPNSEQKYPFVFIDRNVYFDHKFLL